jgi:aminoglycoside 6-adenylyltransferase
MMHNDPFVRRLVRWGQDREAVQAILLTGSRAHPGAPVDAFSDYDVLLVVEDIHPFSEDRTWLEDFGPLLVVYWDPIHPAPGVDVEQVGNVTLYRDGLRVDFILWPVELLPQIAQAPALPADLDLGYVVLLDKQGLAAGLPAPTYSAYIPAPPSDDVYQQVVADFFSGVPYVAKCLRRDELLPAKYCLDFDMKHNFLRRMLDWRVALDHNWSLPMDYLGRGLKKRLPPDLWSDLEGTYVGAGIEENWDALFRTLALFRKVAVQVAGALGYVYPLDMDRHVVAYARQARGRA